HAFHGEAVLGGKAAGRAVEAGGGEHGPDEAVVVGAEVAGPAVVDDLGGGPHRAADDRCPRARDSIMTMPNGSGQAMGLRRQVASARSRCLSWPATSPMYSTSAPSCGSTASSK